MPANTIAVLPFKNIGADPQHEYFSDGITEAIIHALAKIEGLKVTSRTSSFAFKGKEAPLRAIAEQLKVDVILEGSVRTAGKQVRISAQLLQAEEDFHFWSETWDRKLENIFELEDEISLLIADKLREQFGHFEIEDHLVSKQTESLDAYTHSLKARYHFNQWNPAEVQKAIDLYEEALKLDPGHVESLAGLADAYGFLATIEQIPRKEGWAKATSYIEQAYALNPEHAGVHYQLANQVFFVECDFKLAYQHAKRAIQLMPNYAEAQQFMAFLHTITLRFPSAKKHLDIAFSLDPLSQETLFFSAYYHFRSGKRAKALSQVDECLENNPHNIPAYVLKAYCLIMMDRLEEALAFVQGMPESIEVAGDKLGLQCIIYHRMNDKEHAEALLAQLKKAAEDTAAFQAHSYLWMVYAVRNEADLAFEWLEQILPKKSSVLLLSFAGPFSQSLHADPRFSEYQQKLYGSQAVEPVSTTSRKPTLEADVSEKVSRLLLAKMEEEELFLNPNLSLRTLATLMDLHPNQLSWLINKQLNQNFNQFVNYYRIAHFKKLAADEGNAHISILGLAYESGFNSKSVFNTAFKKEEGMTPGAYLKSLK